VTRRGWVLFLLMGVIWGVPYLLIKVAVRDLEPTVVVFGRTAVGAALLLPIAVARGEIRPVLARWRPLLAYTVAEMGIPWLAVTGAEQRLPSSVTGLLVAAVPIVGVGVSRLAGSRERVDRRRWTGMAIGLSGVAALVGLDLGTSDVPALLAMVLVVIGYAVGPMLIARSLSDVPALGVAAASVTLCGLAYAPAAAVQWPAYWPPGRVVAAVVTLGVVCTAAGFLIFFRLIAEIGPVRATVITYVNPAVAVLLGVAFLGERFSTGTALGFCLVLGGSVLATWRSPSPVADPGVTGTGSP
jgi:drug/metabolite transporter (DMT)-like permease